MSADIAKSPPLAKSPLIDTSLKIAPEDYKRILYEIVFSVIFWKDSLGGMILKGLRTWSGW